MGKWECTFWMTSHPGGPKSSRSFTETVEANDYWDARSRITNRYGNDPNFSWRNAIEKYETPKYQSAPIRVTPADPNEGFLVNFLNGFREGSGSQGPAFRTNFRDRADLEAHAAAWGIPLPNENVEGETKQSWFGHMVEEVCGAIVMSFILGILYILYTIFIQ